MKKYFFPALFLSTLLFSCYEDSLCFRYPQPVNAKNLKEIPNELRGTFSQNNDTVTLTISDKMVIRRSLFPIHWAWTTPDSASAKNYSGDTLYTLNDLVQHFKVVNDTMIGYEIITDTLFTIGPRHVVRKYNGSYYFNFPSDSLNYYVRKVDISGKVLNVAYISFANIERFMVFSEFDKYYETKDTTKKIYGIEPKGNEFNDFVRMGGFDAEEVYIRKK
ncbi:MAG: hypothetical protein HY064_15405 [Bacteroidetes bacterium]|nr:hypothetical protein [Bacteroidota bacterium]